MESLHIHQDSNYNFSSIVSKIKVPEDLPAWASEITQQVKVMADKLDHLNSIPETHTVEGGKKSMPTSFPLTSTPTPTRTCVCACTHTENYTDTHRYTNIYTEKHTQIRVRAHTHKNIHTQTGFISLDILQVHRRSNWSLGHPHYIPNGECP